MAPKEDNKRQKVDKTIEVDEGKITPKKLFTLLQNEYYEESDYDSDSSSDSEDESEWTYEEIKRDIHDINDLIELGKMYDPGKRINYNIDLYTLSKLVEPLEKLNAMIGLDNIKQNIVGQIIYHMQRLDDKEDDMMHTVIQGSPGVGKTMLGRILGDIYFNMGILKGNKRTRYGKK